MEKGRTIILMMGVLFLGVSAAQGLTANWYVDVDATGDANGASWEHAFTTIQDALDKCDDVNDDVIRVAAGTYPTEPIIIDHDKIEIDFAPDVNVTAKSGEFDVYPGDPCDDGSKGDCLFKVVSQSDIVFDGNDTIFHMQRAEYIAEYPNTSEYRHVLWLAGCTNVSISSVILKDSGGDGLVLTRDFRDWNHPYCENIDIYDVTCDNNYRNGITIGTAETVTISDCVIKNTDGTSPQSGIDFEPALESVALSRLKNIVVRDCSFEGNDECGILIALQHLSSGSEPVSILVENVNISSSPSTNADNVGIAVLFVYSDLDASGTIKFKNVTVEDTVKRNLDIRGKSKDGPSLAFEECIFKDTSSTTGWPICIRANDENVTYPGGIELVRCRVYEDHNVGAIEAAGDIGSGGLTLYDVTGDIYVANASRIPDDPADDEDSNCLFDWNGADTNGVTLTVEPMAYNVTDDAWYSSVQSAINDASTSDVIEVSPCTHEETIDFANKAITVRSIDPTDSDVVDRTIINAEGNNYGVSFDGTEGSGSILQGLTITGATQHGIYCYGTSPVIEDCNIVSNGGSSYDGGGMLNDDASPAVTRCIFKDNTGDWGGGMCNDNDSSPAVSDCLFLGNYADDEGGGMSNDNDSSPTVLSCVFAENYAYDKGGGMKNEDYSSPTVINCVFYDNESDYYGGAICNEDDGVFVLINCTLFDNYAAYSGGAIRNSGDADLTVYNSILWGNDAGSSGEEVYNSGDAYFEDCCIEGDLNGPKFDGGSCDDGGGNTNEGLEFVSTSDIDGADDTWATSDDGLALKSTSDLIDEGDDDIVEEYEIETDIKGDDRNMGSDPDIGAYEYYE